MFGMRHAHHLSPITVMTFEVVYPYRPRAHNAHVFLAEHSRSQRQGIEMEWEGGYGGWLF